MQIVEKPNSGKIRAIAFDRASGRLYVAFRQSGKREHEASVYEYTPRPHDAEAGASPNDLENPFHAINLAESAGKMFGELKESIHAAATYKKLGITEIEALGSDFSAATLPPPPEPQA